MSYAVSLLENAGFLLSAKSVTTPTRTIIWLGKVIDSTHLPYIQNHTTQFAKTLAAAILVLLAPFSTRRLLRLLGLLRWASRPASELGIFLPSLYHLSRRRHPPRFIPLQLWQTVLQACILTFLPASLSSPPMPLTLPPFFVDAAPQPPLFRVGTNYLSRSLTSCLAPAWVRSQNQAELYANFHCPRQAALRSHTHLCIITDSTAAYFALFTG